jgi:hypothetical protein
MEKLWDKDIERLFELKNKGILEERDLLEIEKYYSVNRDDIIICLTVAELRNKENLK